MIPTPSCPSVLIINGSPRSALSNCRLLSLTIARALTLVGVQPRLWHLADHPLPLMDPAVRENPPTAVSPASEFFTAAREAAGFVWVTPVYHGSFSGCLKNALDYLSSRAVQGKVVGLASHAGGIRTALPLSHLRDVARSLGLYVACTEVCTDDTDVLPDQPTCVPQFGSEAILERLNKFSLELAELAVIHQCREETLRSRR
jgi:azobenzene reductase